MDFHVELSDQAQRDIAAIYDWLRSQQAGDAGERWSWPSEQRSRHWRTYRRVARLHRKVESQRLKVRQLLYGRRPQVYRILFAIEGDVVQVLHIRHGRRRPVRLDADRR